MCWVESHKDLKLDQSVTETPRVALFFLSLFSFLFAFQSAALVAQEAHFCESRIKLCSRAISAFTNIWITPPIRRDQIKKTQLPIEAILQQPPNHIFFLNLGRCGSRSRDCCLSTSARVRSCSGSCNDTGGRSSIYWRNAKNDDSEMQLKGPKSHRDILRFKSCRYICCSQRSRINFRCSKLEFCTDRIVPFVFLSR